MKKTRLLAITLAFIALLQVVSGYIELEIISPEDGATFKTDFDGNVEFDVIVENNGDEPALNVTLEATAGGLDIGEGGQLEIPSGETGVFNIHGSGMSTSVTSVTIRILAIGQTIGGEEYRSDRITVIIYPPLLKAKIIAPVGTKRIVYPTTGSYNFKVWVENQGEADLAGVELVFEPVIGNFSCSYSGPQDLKKGKKISYDVTCTGLESGDSLRIRAYDEEKLSKDIEVVSFYFIEPVAGRPSLRIITPKEGQNITISESKRDISVIIRNNGSEVAEDVCVTVKNVSVSGGNCSDIGVGETHTYVLIVEEVPDYVISSFIEAKAISSDYLERVSVRIKPLVQPQNVSDTGIIWIGDNQPGWLMNFSSSQTNATSTDGDTLRSPDTEPAKDLSLMILIVVAVLLGIYIMIGLYWKSTKKGRREKMLEERKKKIEEFDRELQKSRIK